MTLRRGAVALIALPPLAVEAATVALEADRDNMPLESATVAGVPPFRWVSTWGSLKEQYR